MDQQDAQKLAHALFEEHALTHWKFRFDSARNRLGACHFDECAVSLSRHLVALNGVDTVRETLLHEIAHALVGPGHGHDATWQAMARKLGCSTQASADASVNLPEPRWQLWCDHCATVVARRHRRRLRIGGLACRQCGPQLSRLTWREHVST